MRPRRAEETHYGDNPLLAAAQLEIFARELSELYRREKSKTLELAEAVERLNSAFFKFAMSFALLVEAHDLDTRTHLDRTLRWATAISERLGIAVDALAELRVGYLLHDIGKANVPPEIINKPGPLTSAEWRIMRTHPAAGAQMVMGVVPECAIEVIRCHHERWDGEGYPRGIRGDSIPVGARIFTVVDVFDALTSARSYRAEMSFEQAFDIIKKDRGTAFDPDVVDAFLDFITEVAPPTDGTVEWIEDPVRQID